jgi:hypothetical protein
MAFPTSNLPTASVPWGREVEKQLTTATLTIASNELNNAARDNQLASSLVRVNKAATDAATAAAQAQAAIDGLGSLDQSTSTYKINADNLTAGTITGLNIIGNTIKSAASGTRVELSGTNIRFYYGTSEVGYITGNSTTYGDGMYFGTPADGRFLQISQSWLGFQYGLNNSMGISNGQVMIGGSNGVLVSGTLSGGTASFTTTGTTTLSVTNYASIPSITSSLEVQGALNTAQTLRRSTLAGGSLTGASITADGYFQRTSSSARYKQDIEDLNISYDDILQLSPKKFRRKDEVESNPDARYYAGFIAEDIAGSPMDIFAFYQSEKDGGLPDGVYYSEITSALLIAIKHQDALIKDLSQRISNLENN